MADVIVRQASLDDVEDIYRIEKLCFPDPWSRDALNYEWGRTPRAFYIVAELGGDIVGYAGLWWIMDEGHITNVAVMPGFRNRKIGIGDNTHDDRFYHIGGDKTSYPGGQTIQ